MRRIVPEFEPEVKVSREEADRRHAATQTAFLSHSNVCEECRHSDGRDVDLAWNVIDISAYAV
jgi:hypothetical protein